MHEVAVDRAVNDGTELLVVRFHESDGDDEYVYARPVGQDTWFHFVGTDSTHRTVDPFGSPADTERRAEVDRILLERGYPVRTRDGTTPTEGQLEVLTTDGTRASAFYTHPGTFVVYRDQGPTPRSPPDGDTVHIAILDHGEDEIRVRVDAPGGPPPEYAIREATLAPFGRATNPATLPSVTVEN